MKGQLVEGTGGAQIYLVGLAASPPRCALQPPHRAALQNGREGTPLGSSVGTGGALVSNSED